MDRSPLTPLTVKVQLEAADVRRGLLLTVVRHTPGARMLPLFYGLAALGLAAGITLVAGGYGPAPAEWMFGALLVAFLVLVPGSLERHVRRGFGALRETHSTWEFRQELLRLHVGDSLTTLRWPTIFASHETRRAFYVHPVQGAFLVLPKRALSEAEIDTARSWLEAKVERQSRVLEVLAWLSPSAMMVLALLTYAAYRWVSG